MRQKSGARDFFTSVAWENYFGQLLAFPFAAWWNKSNCPTMAMGNQVAASRGWRDPGDLGRMFRWLQRNRPRLFERWNIASLNPPRGGENGRGKRWSVSKKQSPLVFRFGTVGATAEWRGIIFSMSARCHSRSPRDVNAEARNWVERASR